MLELLERQKTLTINEWKIIATANLGDMLDFFDLFLIGYALAFKYPEKVTPVVQATAGTTSSAGGRQRLAPRPAPALNRTAPPHRPPDVPRDGHDVLAWEKRSAVCGDWREGAENG